jgi:hypothetical protein
MCCGNFAVNVSRRFKGGHPVVEANEKVDPFERNSPCSALRCPHNLIREWAFQFRRAEEKFLKPEPGFSHKPYVDDIIIGGFQ